jgi:Flp pilus assembly protein TadD
MNKNTLISIFLTLSTAITLAGCAASFQKDQLNFGIQAAQRDLWDEAIFRWKKVLNMKPDSAAAYNNLAVAYEKKGLLEEAEKAYQAALKLSPNNDYIQANYKKLQKNLEMKNEESDEKNEKKQ